MTAPYMVRRRRRHQLVLPAAFPTGLLGWQSADYESAFTDAGAVSQLTNQKDGSVWGSQSTGTNQPTFRTAGINGKRAVQFATDDYLDMPAGTLGWLQNVAGATYVGLLRLTSVVAVASFGPSFLEVSSGTRFGHFLGSGGEWRVTATPTDGGSSTSATGLVAADTNAHVVQTTWDGVAGTLKLWVDGAPVANAAITAGSTSNTASGRARFGANLSGGTVGNFANQFSRHSALWAVAYDNVALAPLVRSWCQDGGITYAGV